MIYFLGSDLYLWYCRRLWYIDLPAVSVRFSYLSKGYLQYLNGGQVLMRQYQWQCSTKMLT